jgi:hypothetical protein
VGVVLELLKEEIDRTIKSLDSKAFEPDPIAGPHFSKITSVMSSAYKRHGMIIERAILESLKRYPHFKVWNDHAFQVSPAVDAIVAGSISEPKKLIGTDYPYSPGTRSLQVDIIIFDERDRTIRAYEVKRGFGWHDSGKKRSMLRDVLCVQVLLKSHGKEKGFDISNAFSRMIFYYGKCSIPKPFSLTGGELDDHFQCGIHAEVEDVNHYFRSRLFEILAGGN